MLVLLKNNLNQIKDGIFECFFKENNKLLFFFKYFFTEHVIIESLSLENIIKDLKSLFSPEKETKAIKDRILRDFKNLFEHEEEENYLKQVRTSNFWSNSYVEYESNSHRNKTLSVEEYLNTIKLYLKDIINDLKKSDTQKIQLTIANNFIFTKDNNEEHIMHSKSDSIEIMINDKADEVIKNFLIHIKTDIKIIWNQ